MVKMILVESCCGQNSNLGDEAILSANLHFLLEKKCKVIVLSGKPEQTSKLHGVKAEQGFAALTKTPNRIRRRFRVIWLAFRLVLASKILEKTGRTCLLNKKELNFLQLFRSCKALLIVGGGFFRDGLFWVSNDISGAFPKGIAVLLAKTFKKPVYLGAQTLGPLRKWYHKLFCQIILRKADFLCVREPFSVETAKKLGFPFNPKITIDDAFNVESTNEKRAKELLLDEGINIDEVKKKEMLIGFSSRGLGTKNEELREKALDFLRRLLKKGGIHILVIPTMYGDQHKRYIEEAEKISGKTEIRSKITFLMNKYTYRDVKSFFSLTEATVAISFHSAVFALSSNVPAIGLYENEYYKMKLKGMFMILGFEGYALEVHEATLDEIYSKFDELIRNRFEIREYLSQKTGDLSTNCCLAAKLISKYHCA